MLIARIDSAGQMAAAMPFDKPSGRARAPAVLGRVLSATPPPLLVLLSILSIQLGVALTVDLYAALSPLAFVSFRLGLSSAILLIASHRFLGRYVFAQAGSLLLFGIALAAMNVSFFEAVARLPLGVAVTVEFVGPLALSGILSRRGRDILLVAVAAGGVALLAPEIGGGLDPAGVALAAIAGLAWAGVILAAKHTGRHLPGFTGLALGMSVAAVLTVPLAIASGGLTVLGPGVLVLAFAITVLGHTLPLSFEFAALKRLSPRAFGILVTLEPAVAALVGAALLGQRLDHRSIVAMALVTTAAIGVALSERRPPQAG